MPRPVDEDALDYHDPTAGIGGAPPARSALGLRLALAIFGVVVCAVSAATFATVGSAAGAVIFALCAVVAVVDAVVVGRRLHRERRRMRLTPTELPVLSQRRSDASS
jgi:hypothetical protein